MKCLSIFGVIGGMRQDEEMRYIQEVSQQFQGHHYKGEREQQQL